MSDKDPPPQVVAEPVEPRDPKRLAHLAEHRGLIIRRSLLATGLGNIPLPVMDDYVASRVRAGLYIKLASVRKVDLPQAAADLLSDPQDPSLLRNATTLAAALRAMRKRPGSLPCWTAAKRRTVSQAAQGPPVASSR